MQVDFLSLKRSRETRAARGPASAPSADAVPELPSPPAAAVSAFRPDLARRKAEADTSRSELEARTAALRVGEADGRLIQRSRATAAMMEAGVGLIRAFEECRRDLIAEVREAADVESAEVAVARFEDRMRAALAPPAWLSPASHAVS
jgi:hypothetical protein